ncbi:PREDICTED: probable disease resistance protein At4g27220-like [Fragaria vesca subsp. vesca]
MSIAFSEDGHGFLVRAGCKLKDWPRGMREGYSAISLMGNKIRKLPKKLVCSKLQILLLQANYDIKEIPKSFFESPTTLMVLDFSKTSISSLPQSVSLLTNLHALYLDSCKKIIDISILGNLKKLEILSMRKIPLMELPEEIGKLADLRMLDVTGGCVDTIPSEVLSKLYSLEELHMQCDFGHRWSEVKGPAENNICFAELTSLEYLITLKINISYANFLPKDIEIYPNWVNFNIGICKKSLAIQYHWVNLFLDDDSRTLTLDTTITMLPDWFITVVTAKTEKLQYVECRGLCNILVEHEQGRLDCLKYLTLFGPHERLEKLMNTTTLVLPNKSVFENLEVLDIQVDYLNELCVGDLPTGSLRNLKVLKIEKCYSMENAAVLSNLLKRLQNLETLNCGFMIKLTCI